MKNIVNWLQRELPGLHTEKEAEIIGEINGREDKDDLIERVEIPIPQSWIKEIAKLHGAKIPKSGCGVYVREKCGHFFPLKKEIVIKFDRMAKQRKRKERRK